MLCAHSELQFPSSARLALFTQNHAGKHTFLNSKLDILKGHNIKSIAFRVNYPGGLEGIQNRCVIKTFREKMAKTRVFW